jgi:RNA polymerase sigma-70 factor (ECF subfamily)
MTRNLESTETLLDRADRGDRSAIGSLLERHRGRLKRLVARRLNRRLRARIDASDVVQESLADASRRLPEYLRGRPMGFFPWLRRLALQRLGWSRRVHLVARRRSVKREATDGPVKAAVDLFALQGSSTSPSGYAMRDEECSRVRAAGASLAEIDREILALRYHERLPFAEIAARLGIALSTASMRHVRAIERLHAALESMAPHEASP